MASLWFQDTGPPVIVVPEPGILSDLISERLHALADDYSDELSLDQCAKFYQECREDIVINERLLSDSSESMDTDEEEYIRRRKLKKRVRWKSNISGWFFFYFNIHAETKQGRGGAILPTRFSGSIYFDSPHFPIYCFVPPLSLPTSFRSMHCLSSQFDVKCH